MYIKNIFTIKNFINKSYWNFVKKQTNTVKLIQKSMEKLIYSKKWRSLILLSMMLQFIKFIVSQRLFSRSVYVKISIWHWCSVDCIIINDNRMVLAEKQS